MKTLNKALMVALATSMVVCSFADRTKQQFNGPIGTRQADFCFKVDAQGNRVGPIIAIPHDLGPATAPWVTAWDSNNTDPAGPTIMANYYGTNNPNWYWGAGYGNLFYSNDLQTMNPGTEGLYSTYQNLRMYQDAAQNTVIIMWNSGLFGSDNTQSASGYSDLSGVAFIWNALPAGGWYLTTGDTAPLGIGVPMPYNGGGSNVQVAAWNGTQIVPSTTSAQPLWGGMLSATSTPAGTNPSNSTDMQWDDDSPSNYAHDAGELYNYTYTSDNPEQAGVGYLIGVSDLYNDGVITYDSWGCMPYSETFNIIASDANGTPLRDNSGAVIWTSETVALSLGGDYELLNPQLVDANSNPVQFYMVQAKSWMFLRGTMGPFNWSTPVNGSSITLLNGDIDQDNEVGPGDFGAFSTAYGAADGDPNYNFFADLDCDGEVGPSDFGIFSTNYGLTGDDDLTQ